MRRASSRAARAIAPAATVAIASLVLLAPAAEGATTRADFAAQVEPLCVATNTAIAQRSLREFRSLKKFFPKKGEGEPSRRQEARTFRAFFGATGRVTVFEGQALHALNRQIMAVPEPPADEMTIAEWIESRRVDAEALKETGHTFKVLSKKFKPIKFFAFVFASISLEERLVRTDAIVGAFDLHACLLAERETPTLRP